MQFRWGVGAARALGTLGSLAGGMRKACSGLPLDPLRRECVLRHSFYLLMLRFRIGWTLRVIPTCLIL